MYVLLEIITHVMLVDGFMEYSQVLEQYTVRI